MYKIFTADTSAICKQAHLQLRNVLLHLHDSVHSSRVAHALHHSWQLLSHAWLSIQHGPQLRVAVDHHVYCCWVLHHLLHRLLHHRVLQPYSR
jgi:hypothetical protein